MRQPVQPRPCDSQPMMCKLPRRITIGERMNYRSDAHRAAAQAVAAILNGVLIDSLDCDGITIVLPDAGRTRGDFLAEATVGLAGIVAVGCWGYGSASDGTYYSPLKFDEGRSPDIVRVGGLVDAVDPLGTDDALLLAWQEALALVSTPSIWRAIERIAKVLELGEISGDEVITLFDHAMDLEMPSQMIAFGSTGPLGTGNCSTEPSRPSRARKL